jgi:predicted nucleotidyltransferase
MALEAKQRRKIRELCRSLPSVKLLYFFGSRRKGRAGAGRDYDFAVLFSRRKGGYAKLQLKMLGALISTVKHDAVDLVVLNKCWNSILKYNIISQGELLFQRPGAMLDFEIPTMNEYFDFRLMEKRCFPE